MNRTIIYIIYIVSKRTTTTYKETQRTCEITCIHNGGTIAVEVKEQIVEVKQVENQE